MKHILNNWILIVGFAAVYALLIPFERFVVVSDGSVFKVQKRAGLVYRYTFVDVYPTYDKAYYDITNYWIPSKNRPKFIKVTLTEQSK